MRQTVEAPGQAYQRACSGHYAAATIRLPRMVGAAGAKLSGGRFSRRDWNTADGLLSRTRAAVEPRSRATRRAPMATAGSGLRAVSSRLV